MNNQWRGCATEGTERVTHGNIEIFAGFADGRGFSDHPDPGFLRPGQRFPGCLPGKSRWGFWISGFAPCAATRAHAPPGDRLENEQRCGAYGKSGSVGVEPGGSRTMPTTKR